MKRKFIQSLELSFTSLSQAKLATILEYLDVVSLMRFLESSKRLNQEITCDSFERQTSFWRRRLRSLGVFKGTGVELTLGGERAMGMGTVEMYRIDEIR